MPGVQNDDTVFFFSSRRRHTRLQGDWSSDVCSSDLAYDVASSPHERASAIKPSRRSGDLCHAAAGYGSSVTLNGALVAPLTAGPLATSEIGRASCRERG